MNFQLKETAPKSSKFSPKGAGYKLFDFRGLYFNMENQEEIWKDVVGREGYYMVSNFGNVKSLAKGNTASGLPTKTKDKIMATRPHTVDSRYRQIKLYRGEKESMFLIHRLVAIAFIPNPLNKKFINHIDGNPSNNCVENLEWCTRSENLQHSYDKLGRNGRRIPTIKLSSDGFVLAVYKSQTEAAVENNTYSSEISRCCNHYKNGAIGRTRPTVNGFIYM